MSAVRNTQDEDYPVPPADRWVHRTKFQDAGPLPESGMPGDEAGVGRARAIHPDELPGYASSQHEQTGMGTEESSAKWIELTGSQDDEREGVG